MNQTFNTTGRISLNPNVVPKLLYTDGLLYLDFFSIRQICAGGLVPKTSLYCILKELPMLEQKMVKYRNRNYYLESFILLELKHLIFV